MSLIGLLAAGVMGAVGGALGYIIRVILKSTVLKGEEKQGILKLLVPGTVVIFLILGNFTLLPVFDKMDMKAKLEGEFKKTSMGLIFDSIRQHDPAYYESFLDQLTTIAVKGRQESDKDIYLQAQSFGAQASKKYFLNATTQSILEYMKTYLQLLEVFNEKDPILVCQHENPGIYGPLKDFVGKKFDFERLAKSMENVVISGTTDPQGFDKTKGTEEMNQFLIRFFNEYPSAAERLAKTEALHGDDLKALSSDYINLYRELLKLDADKMTIIFKTLKDQG